MITAALIWAAMGLFLGGGVWGVLKGGDEHPMMVLAATVTVMLAWPIVAIYVWVRQ